AVSNPTNGTTSQSISTITQAPSIFDIFNAAQLFVNTELVSLSNISSNYILILFYYPLTLLATYQIYNYKDCWLLILLAALCIALFSIGVMFFCSFKILDDLFNDRDAFKKSAHTFIYEPLYSQYHDNPDNPDIKHSRAWFFVFKISYDFIRVVTTGITQYNGLIQIMGLLVTEIFIFFY
ncbi:5028_t:CDS:2, partial [Dentiscutata erythropus]